MGRSQRTWGGVRVGRSQKTGGGGRELGTVSRRDWRFCQGVFLAGGSPALPQRARPEPFVSSLARSRFGAQLRHHCSPAGSEREAGAGAEL